MKKGEIKRERMKKDEEIKREKKESRGSANKERTAKTERKGQESFDLKT